MDVFRKYLTVFVLALACILYLVFLVQAGLASVREAKVPVLPDFPTKVVVVVGGALAVHLGSVLGIELTRGGKSVRAWWTGLNLVEKLQLALATAYFISLCLAVAFWWRDGWSEATANTIQDLSWTLLGVMLGVVSAIGQK